MASRDSSPIGGSDLSSSDALPDDLRRSPRGSRGNATDDNTDEPPLARSDLQQERRRPTAAFANSVTNDSFGQPLGTTLMFANTRPFNSSAGPNEVEQFLAEPPLANQTFTPSAVARGSDTLHVSANSSFVSIPKTGTNSVDVSANTSPRHTNAVPPLVVQSQRLVSPSSTPPTAAATHADPRSGVSFTSSTASGPALVAHASSATTPAAATFTSMQSSPLMAQTRPPMPTVIKATSYSGSSAPYLSKPGAAAGRTPAVLVATASSSGSGSGFGAPRSPSRRTPSAAFPSSASGTVSGTAPPTQAASAVPPVAATASAAAAGHRPASPSLNFTRTASNHSVTSHNSDPAAAATLSDHGVASLANYSPLVRNSLTPSFSPQSSPRPHGYPAAPLPGQSPPAGQRSGLVHSRSEGELHTFFSDRGLTGGVSPTPSAATVAMQMRHGSDTPGGAGRRSPSRLGGPAVSTTSRQRGVVRASESSFGGAVTHNSSRHTPSGSSVGSGGAAQPPRWMSAVERMRYSRAGEDLSLYNPVLPYDQSRLGMQARAAGQQGQLTAGKLRALEAQQAAGGYSASRGSDRTGSVGGPQPLVAFSVAGGRMGSPTSRASGVSPHRFPVLTAQEEAIQATARYGRAMSEQSGGRRAGHISAYGGSRQAVNATPPSSRGSVNPVLTATETATTGSVNGNFISRSENGGIPSGQLGGFNSRFTAAEHRMANLFQMHSHANPHTLRANESSAMEVVTASGTSGRGSYSTGPVLRATEEQRPNTPGTGRARSAGGGSRGNGGGGGGSAGGGGGGGGNGNDNKGSSNGRMRAKRKDLSEAGVTQSRELKKAMDAEGDEDERDERTFRTRNINALHAIPWDQRYQLPMTGFGTRFFALLSTPRFWEKLDWTVRGSILTVLPTMVLALEPTTTGRFPMASSLAFNAFWITMPTFGSGLRELVIALKGFSFGLLFLIIVVATEPGPDWLLLLLLFVFTLFASFVAEEIKKTTAYVLASTIMQYLTDHKGTNFSYVGQYYEGLLIALAFGTAAFVVPFIRWSSDIARHYIKAMANSLSIDVQGTLSSFWVRTPLERELNVMRLRQLRATAEKCIGKIETALDESGYEPHTGAFMACMTNRFNFCKNIHNILGSLSHVIEMVADNPSSIDTPMCNAFGEQIGDDLAVISSAMDSMVLKICDFERIVTPQEIQYFREARERFQEAVSRVREDVILTNENYETDESDILLGFFMFSVDEMCEVISQFTETANPPNTLKNALLFPIRDIKSVIFAFKNLALTIVRRRTIPRRLKEAIKLAVCMVLPCIFQVYALGNDSVSPMAGASVIALIYNPTGAESFHYASGRLLGTVLGSMAALLSVQIADGRRWVLYLFIVVLSFIGAYVQAAPGFYALGNAIVCSTISICTQYTNQNAAMTRIQQNCFAILMYFAVVCILWPMRARTKVTMSLDFSLRCMRESITRMLRNLDMPPDPNEVAADVSALLLEMNKKVRTQIRFIPGAVEEPTMGSVEYPEDAWKRIVEAERKLWLALSMMRFAYHTFMSSRADSTTELSVHWVVLHRISPHAQDLSDLIYAAIDLYLLSLNHTTVVPTSHLTRLRVGMVEAHKAIEDTYIQTISRKVAGEDSEDEEGEEGAYNDSYLDSYGDEDDYYVPSDYGGLNRTHNSNANGGGGGGAADGAQSAPPTTANGRAGGGSMTQSQNVKDGSNHGSPAPAEDQNKQPQPQQPNASFAAPKQEGMRRRRHNHKNNKSRREGGERSSSASSSSSSSSGHSSGDSADKDGAAAKANRKGKKKIGYLGYEMTKEEQAALRAFVANRVVNNGTFGLNRSMVGGNTTFNGRTMNGAAAAAAAAALSGGGLGNRSFMAGSPPQLNNDTRMMALSGGDDGLAATLRKKHNIVVKKDKDDGEAGKSHLDNTFAADGTAANARGKPKPSGDPNAESQTDPLSTLHLNNASFFKNHSFLRNTSFLGNLFSKKPKEPHDLDAEEMRGAEVSSSTSAASKSGRRSKRDANEDGKERSRCSQSAVAQKAKDGAKRGDDDAASSGRSTPSTSPTRSRHALHSDAHSVASEFSDIEDDPKPGSAASKKLVNAAKPRAAKAAGGPPMAQSMPVVLPLTGGTATLHATGEGNPLADGKTSTAAAGDKAAVRMASSSPVVSRSQHAVRSQGELDGPPGAVPLSEPPLTISADGSPFGVTPVDTRVAPSAAAPPPAVASPTTGVAQRDGDTPDDAGKGVKATRSHDSSHHTGGTEKKFLSGGEAEAGTTHGSSDEKEPRRSEDTSDGVAKAPRPTKRDAGGKGGHGLDGDDVATHQTSASHPTRQSTSMPFHGPPSPGRGPQRPEDVSVGRTAALLQSMRDGSHDGSAAFDEAEVLNNISFFDPEKGEFVLTNHDIHSLEAFLFGSKALVNYINELQKAILEMQHATDLAKRL